MSARLIPLHGVNPMLDTPRGRVVLVHGIHSPEGSSNIRRLWPAFARCGFDVAIFEYGFVSALGARWRNPGIAAQLVAALRQGDHVVAHSNGCAVFWLASQRSECPHLDHVSLVAPALDSARCVLRTAQVDVYHNRADRLVGLSRLLLAHAWGAMGRDGAACGNLARNFDTLADDFSPQIAGHLGYFEPGVVERFARRVAARHLFSTR